MLKNFIKLPATYDKPIIVMEPLRGGMLAELPSKEAEKDFSRSY